MGRRRSEVDDLQKKQSPPLSEREIISVYRNEFFAIDNPRYFDNRRYCLIERGLEKKYFKKHIENYCKEQSEDIGY